MVELLGFISELLHLYTIILLAAVIVSILVQTRAIPYSPMLRSIQMGLAAVTEPFLAPIRRRLPATGGVDLSPIVLWLIILFIQRVVLPNIAKAAV